jgi:hypothetical protein
MVCILKHGLSLRPPLQCYFIISFEKYKAKCTKCVVVGSWMHINLILQVHLSCDRQQGVVLLSNVWTLQVCVCQ